MERTKLDVSACDAEFAAASFAAHLSDANSMRSATPEQQKAMMAEFKRKFDEAPNV
jgi:hypothetical protein